MINYCKPLNGYLRIVRVSDDDQTPKKKNKRRGTPLTNQDQ
jgi:hypothetical protein